MKPFVSPQKRNDTKDGDLTLATEAGGLFGMDVADDGMESDERENLSEAQEQVGSPEAHEAKIKPSPEKPTQDEVARHDATHCPYRSWCEVCVAASAREDLHP